jgi:hypothetical protein
MYLKIKNSIGSFILLILFMTIATSFAQSHPCLVMTKKGVEEIRTNLGKAPLFDSSLTAVKTEIDAAILSGIEVPIPKDMAGGFSHEIHKKNYLQMQKAGFLYQILNDTKYADYIKKMLLEYTKMYPTLPLHPQERSYARGKLFWQALNDANWLVYTSQAYDCIYEYLTKKERENIEKNLFKPFADFLSKDSPQFFNRVHNHSTWGNVAVGMIALVMNDNELLDSALNGLKNDGILPGQKDNDGGLIKKEGQKPGFFGNVDDPFSPNGYYTEGPYYQRYAMYPFLVFAVALQNNRPDLKIFEYKDGVLIKSVYTLLNLTTTTGEFFPLNDAQKGMSYYSRELVSVVNFAYYYGTKDPSLLSIAKLQNRVQLDNSGMAVALALNQNLEKPFDKKSIEYTDGFDGKQGGVAILRSQNKEDESTLVFKYTAQGLSHGHYDKLSFSYYNKGAEVIQDYGLARFVNIEQKNGGGYLKENTTWAKQTIAHNTVIQNESSHFNGDFEKGSMHHSDKYLFDVSNPKFQVVSAVDNNAYPGTSLQRTMVTIQDEDYQYPLLIDITQINSDKKNQYDLPYYYLGQIMATDFKYESSKNLAPLGTAYGYQHLWKEASGITSAENSKISWLLEGHFYTLTTALQTNDEILFVRVGANDPDFNLRRDPGIILRKKDTQKTTFLTALETHGSYSPVTEYAGNAYSAIDKIEKIYEDDNYIGVCITNKNKNKILFLLNTKDNSATKNNEININNTIYKWSGAFYHTKTTN